MSLEEWLDRYGRAWAESDGQAAAALFTHDARYDWGPFSTLHGREQIAARWDEATGDQRSAVFTAQPLSVDGDRHFITWQTVIDDAIELDGIFILDFEPGGLCTRLQEWWLSRELSV